MKSSNFIKLLALLLCVVMMFASCSIFGIGEPEEEAPEVNEPSSEPETGEEPETEPEATPQEPENSKVYSSLSELLEIKNKTPDYIKETLKLDGDIYHSDGIALVMKKATIGTDNLAKEVYNVYNLTNGACVLTVENSFDYYAAEYERESEVNVYLASRTRDDITCTVIVVEKITRSILSSEETAGNYRYGSSLNYKEEKTYELYDMAGVLFDTANYVSVSGARAYLSFDFVGNINAPFIVEVNGTRHSMDLASKCVVTEAEANSIRGVYDFVRGAFGYKHNDSYVQVYNKATGEILAQYNVEGAVWCVLQNGDIFVQYDKLVTDDGADYDYYTDGGKRNLETYIINVASGEKTEIETNYIIREIYAYSELKVMAGLYSDYMPYEINYKDTIINFATARLIVDKKLSDKTTTLFVDSKFNVMFATDSLVEAPILAYEGGYEYLPNGSVLYRTFEGYQIIVDANGKETVLPAGAEVHGYFIVTETKIYDLELNVVVEREKYGTKLTFVCAVADWTIFASDTIADEDNPSETRYYRLYKSNNGFKVELLSDVESIVESNYNYLVAINGNGKYVLYNANYEHVYTTENSMYVESFGEQYWIFTYSNFEGKYVAYQVN